MLPLSAVLASRGISPNLKQYLNKVPGEILYGLTYKCYECGMSFRYEDDLVLHLRLHNINLDSASVIREPNKQNKVQKNKNVRKKFNSSASAETSSTSTTRINTTNKFCPTLLHISPKTTDTRNTYKTLRGDMNNSTLEEISSQTTIRRAVNTRKNNKCNQQRNKCKEHKQIISEGTSIVFNKCIQFQKENASNKPHSSNNLFASNIMLSQISEKRDKVNRTETQKKLSNAVFKNSPRLQKEFPKRKIVSGINSKIGCAIEMKTKRHSRSSIPNRAGRILANAIQKNLNLRKQQARVRKSLKTLSVLSEKVAKSVGRSQTPRKSASCIMKDDQKLSHKTNSVIANKVNEYPDKILEKEFSDIHKELKNKSVLKKSQNDDPDNIIDTASYKSQKIRKKKSLKKIQTDKLVEIVNESNSVILETVEGEKMATKVDLDHGGNNISEFHCNEMKEKYLFGSSVELKQCSITLSRLDTSAPSNLTENNIGAMNDTSQGKNQLKNSNKTSCKFNNSAPKKRGRISNDNSIYPSLVSDSSVSYAGEGLTCKDPHSVSENQDNEHAACSSVQSNDIFSPIKNPKDLKTSQLQDSVKIIATNIMSDIAEKNTTNSYGKTNPNIMVPSVCIVPKENSGTEDPNPKKHELACKLEMDKNLLSDSEIDPDIFFSYLKIIEANKILEVSKKNTLILNPTTSYEIKSPTKRGRNTKMNQNKKCNRETDLDKIVSDLIIDHSKICDVSQENTENTHSETDPDQMVFILIHESNETSDISKDDTATSFRSQSSKKCEFATEINRNKVCERETNHNQIFSDSNICSKEVRRDISKKHKRDSETSGRKYDEINLDFSSEHLSKKHSLFQHRIIVDEEIGPKELCSSLVKDNMPDGIKFDLSELSSGVDKDQAIQNNINQNRTPEKHSQSLTQTEIVSTLHNEGIDSSKIINSVVDVTNNDFTETNQSAINMNTTNDLDVEYKGKSPRKYVRKPKHLITNTFSVDSSENVGTPVNKEIVNVNNKLTGINNTSQPNQCQFFSVKTEFLGEKLTSRKQRQKPNPKNILLPKDKSIYLQATNFHYKDMDTISLLSNSSESIVNSESKNAVYQNISMSSEGKTIPRIGYLFVDGEAQPNNDIEMNSAGMDVLEDQLANNKIFSLTPRRAMTLPDVMDSTKSSGASKKSANKDISAIKLGLPPELLISSVSVPDNRPGFCVTNRYTADILTASIKNNSTAISNSSKKKKGQDSEITNRNIILYKRDDQTMNTNKTLFDMCTNMNTGSRSTDCKEARQTIFDGLRIGSTKITFVRKKEIENPIYRKANYTKELCHSIGVDKYKIYSGPFPEITSSNQNQSLVPEESSNVMINSSTTGSSPMPDTSNSEVNIDFHKIIPETEILCDPTECIIETETSNEYENHLAPALSCTTTWSSIIHLTDGKSDCPVTSSLSVNNKPVPELLNKTVCVVTDLSDKNKSVSESLDRSDSLVTTSLYVNNKPVPELSNKSVCVVTDLSDKNKSVSESLDRSDSLVTTSLYVNNKPVPELSNKTVCVVTDLSDKNKSVSESLDRSDSLVTTSLYVNNKPVPELSNKSVCVVTDLSDKNKSVSESLDRSDSLVTTSLYVNNKPVPELSNKSVCVVTDLSDKNKSVSESLDRSDSLVTTSLYVNNKPVPELSNKSVCVVTDLSDKNKSVSESLDRSDSLVTTSLYVNNKPVPELSNKSVCVVTDLSDKNKSVSESLDRSDSLVTTSLYVNNKPVPELSNKSVCVVTDLSDKNKSVSESLDRSDSLVTTSLYVNNKPVPELSNKTVCVVTDLSDKNKSVSESLDRSDSLVTTSLYVNNKPVPELSNKSVCVVTDLSDKNKSVSESLDRSDSLVTTSLYVNNKPVPELSNKTVCVVTDLSDKNKSVSESLDRSDSLVTTSLYVNNKPVPELSNKSVCVVTDLSDKNKSVSESLDRSDSLVTTSLYVNNKPVPELSNKSVCVVTDLSDKNKSVSESLDRSDSLVTTSLYVNNKPVPELSNKSVCVVTDLSDKNKSVPESLDKSESFEIKDFFDNDKSVLKSVDKSLHPSNELSFLEAITDNTVKPLTMVSSYEDTANRDTMPDHLYSYLCFHNDVPEPELEIDVLTTNNDLLIPAPNFTAMDSDLSSHPITQLSKDSAKVITYSNVPNIEIDSNFTVDSEKLNKIKSKTKQNMSYSGKRKNLKYYREHKIKNDLIAIKFNSETVPGNISINSKPNKLNSIVPKNLSTYSVPKIASSLNAINRASDKHAKQIKNDNKAVTCSENHLGSTSKNKYSKGEVRSNKDEKHLHNRPRSKSNEVKAIKSNASKLKEFDFLATKQRKNYCRKDANQLKSLQKTTNSLSLKHSSDILEREKYECYKRCDTSTVKDRKNSPIKIIQHIINKGSCENTALPGVDSDTNAKIKKVNSENIEINDCLHRSFTKTGGNSHVKQVKVPSQCNMRKHVRITCTHCAQLFSNRYFYKRHLNKVHNCTTFEKCDDCKKAFSGERSSFRLQILDAIKQSILEQRDQKVSGFKIPYVLLRKIDITPYNMTTFSSEIVKQKVCKQLVNTNEAISENYRFNKKTCKSDKQNDNGGSISHQQNCYRQNEGQYEDNTCESQVECRTKNSLQDQKNFVINPPEETVIVQYVTQGSEKTLVTERYSMQISDNMEQSSEDRKNYITSLSEYKCQLCGLEFNSKIQLLSHLNVEHQRSKKNQRKFTKREAKYKCKKCAKSFRYKDYLVRHFNSAHESFTCAICCQEFTSKYNLKVHLRTVHKETCATCKLTFNTKEILMKHLQANHNPGVQNNECMAFHLQDPFENDLETELMMYSNVNKCVLCEDTFDSREELRRHVGFHHIQPRSDREEADNNKKNTKSNQKKELKKKSKENIRSDKEMNDDCHLKNSDISVTMKNVINNNAPIRITGTTIRKDFPIIDTSHQQSCNVEADEKIISDSRVRSKPHSAALLRSRSHTRDSQDTIDSVYEHPSNKFVIDSRRKSFRKKKDLSKTMLHLVENESLQNNKESLETKQVKASKSFDINDSEEEPMEPLVYIESDESDEEPNSSINTSQVSKKIIKNELAVNIDEQSSPNSTYSSEIIDSSLQIDTSNLQIGTEKKTLRKTGKHHDENKTTSPKTTIDTYSDIPKNINEEISQVAEDLELSKKSNSISLRSGNITKKSEENIMKLPKATVSTLERSVVSPKGVSKRRKTTLDTSRLAKCYSNMSQKNKHMSSKRISYRRKTTDSPQLMKDSPQKVYEEISQVQPNFESLTLSHMEVDENIPKRTLRTSIAKRESTSPKATPSVVKLSKRISKRRKTTSDKPHVMKELNTPKKLDKKMLVEYSKCSITEMNKNITIKTIVNTEENNERMSVKAKIPHIQSSASSSQRVSKRRKTTLDSSQLIKDLNIFEKEPSPKCSQTEVVKNEYDNNVSRSLEATIPPGSSSQLVSKHLKATSDTPRLIKNSNFPTKLHKEISPKDLKTSTHLVKDTTDKITNKIVKSTYTNIEHAAPQVSMRRISKRRKTTSDTMPLMKDLESPNNTSVKNIELYSQNDLNLHTACSEPQTSNTYEPINSSHLKGNPVSEINNQIDLMCNPLNYVKCPYCTGFFPSQEARQRHIEWEHMNNVLLHKCGECHQVFETYQTLRQHFVNQHAALSHFECSHDGNDSLDLNRFKWKRCLANSYRNKFDKTAVTKERNCES